MAESGDSLQNGCVLQKNYSEKLNKTYSYYLAICLTNFIACHGE